MQGLMDPSQPAYTQEEVNEILKRALSREATVERVLSHDELVEIATEAGIDRLALDRAMAELAQEHTRALARRGEAAEIAEERKLQLKRFFAALTSHALMNAFLYFLCVRFTGGTWFVWPLLGSGVLLALQLRHVLFPYDKLERRRKRAERQREKERKRAEREEWKQRFFGGRPRSADSGKALEKQFETVVQAGVSALLSVAERKLAEHRQRERDRR
jgi:hypothetical protein